MNRTGHPTRKRRILLVEDHPVTRHGFAQLLDLEEDLQVCGQAGTAAEALRAIATLKPDLVIVDLSLPDRSGLELIKDLGACSAGLPVLVLSTFDESAYAERSLRGGAKGYIMKSEPIAQILAAIHRVLQGKMYLSERMTERLVGTVVNAAPGAGVLDVRSLSDRELEIFQLLGRGRNTAQIAAALKLHPSTVATHRTHIQEKLRLENLSELICRAAQWVQAQMPAP